MQFTIGIETRDRRQEGAAISFGRLLAFLRAHILVPGNTVKSVRVCDRHKRRGM